MNPQEIQEKIEELESAVEAAKEEAANAKRRGNLALEKLAAALEQIDDKAALKKLAQELRDDGF